MKTNRNLEHVFLFAKKAYDEDREAAALEALRPYLKERPDHADAWLMFGDSLRAYSRLKESAPALMRALELAPANCRWEIQGRIGMLRHEQGNYRDAERWYAKACRSKHGKKTDGLWVARGENLIRLEGWGAAETCFRFALTCKAVDKVEAYVYLALAMIPQGRYQESRRVLRKALAINPKIEFAETLLNSLKGYEAASKMAKDVQRLGRHCILPEKGAVHRKDQRAIH